MTTGDDAPADPPINLSKRRPDEPVRERPGPAWIVIPARVVALIVVVPIRLVHDLVVLVARGVRAVWNGLMRAPGRLGRLIGRMLRWVWLGLYRWLLAPVGRLVAAVARGIGALLHLLIVRPLRWLGGGIGHLARWVYRVLIVPVGRFLAMVGRGLGWLLGLLLLSPLRALVRGLAWLAGITGQALTLLFKGIGLLIAVLVVIPAVFVWRYLLRPPLLGLAWLARGALLLLGAVGSVLAAGWRAFAGGVAWSWRLIGRCLAWLARVLVVLPARAVWRYVLAPIAAGVAGTWRLAARVLRWLWRTLVVAPGRVLIVAPARWVGSSVLRPAGRGVRETWRVCVRDPVSSARRTMREAGRDVRLQLRRTFRGR
ncbi:hypothetical protein [Spirillospora sp. NPDC048824]|uniref:hypothetical protein n=1 Tax=Spirillospora sp. NPDC048824 TaxID=3364526 RepID=UPI0037166D50